MITQVHHRLLVLLLTTGLGTFSFAQDAAPSATPAAATTPVAPAPAPSAPATPASAPSAAATPPAETAAAPATIPMGSASDIDPTVLSGLNDLLECKKATDGGDRGNVCAWLTAFSAGERPKAPAKNAVYFGRSYKGDNNGRLVDANYEALIPSESDVARIGRATLKPDNALEELDLQALLQIVRAHQPLPANNSGLDRARQEAQKNMLSVAATNGASVTLGSDANNRLYLRQTKEGFVLLGVSGANPDEQLRSMWIIGGLSN